MDFLQNHSDAEGSLLLQKAKPAEHRMMSKAMALNSDLQRDSKKAAANNRVGH